MALSKVSSYAEKFWTLLQSSTSNFQGSSPNDEAPSATSNPIPAPNQGPPLYGLLIGINAYQYVNQLSGCVADAKAAKEYFEKELGVQPSQLRLLLDKDATRAGIIAALRDLAKDERIKKGDPIVVFYAGHGDETDAPTGWEAGDTKIQMLIPVDYCRSEKWGPVTHGVPDRTVGALLKDLADAKGDNISVIFDCCHSGSGSRKDEVDPTRHIRVVDHIEGVPLVPLPRDLDEDIWKGSRATEIPPGFINAGLRSHVLLAACSAKELAPEVGGRGVFSKELFRTLTSIGADKLTYTDVLFRMNRLPQQNPQCEGFFQDRILFNAKAPSLGRVLYKITKAGDVYTLSAGNAHGVTEEAQFTVYASRESFGSAGPLGTLVVYQTGAFTSKLRALPNNSAFPLDTPGVALQTLAGVEEDLRLHITDSEDGLQDVFAALLNDLQRSDPKRRRVVLVEKEKADYDIAFEKGEAVFFVLNSVVTQYGFSRIPYSVKPTTEDAYPVIQAAAEFNWHLKRANKTPLKVKDTLLRDKIKIQFHKLELGTDLDEDFNRTLTAVGDDLNANGVVDIVVDKDAKYGIKVVNDTGLALFPSLFFFDNVDLSITSYFQPPTSGPYQLDPPLRPHESLAVGYGSGGSAPFNYTVRQGNVEVGFVKLFFSTAPVDLSGVPQKSPFKGGRRGGDRVDIPAVETWDSIVVAIVQRKEPVA